MEALERLERELRQLADRLRALRSQLPETPLPPLAAAAHPDIQPLIDHVLSHLSRSIPTEGVRVLIVGLHRARDGHTTAWYEHFSEDDLPGLLSPELPRALEGLASLERVRLLLALQGGFTSSSELMRESGLTQGQFYHHLRTLEAHRLVRRKGRDEYEITTHGVSSLYTLLAAARYILGPGTAEGEGGEGG